ncbi:hypothetical protein [Arthrobacter sp. NEB 688]|uniref:hypothetical protein n=1 Tax=Arthrobacter sp. NEB 688 TaxID=904039 RepID=UPI001566AB6C|nr:hypothetical protein [Arthrobacter sp. NEB 688]QKE83919.1 hypothetical protein HL663_08175 [Arthrobacter sp. NEB 688]
MLDDLIGRVERPSAGDGVFDGYDGTTHRGIPERLLASEWLLAGEAPLEFLRRAADGELLYLDPSTPDTRARGQTVAVVDVGPDQIGAGRLVQLAALVVLHRRAVTAGSELVVAVLQSGERFEGPLEAVVPRWLESRSAEGGEDRLPEVLASIEEPDRAWVLCGPATASLLRGRARLLQSEVSTWSEDGVDAVSIRVANSHAVLHVPDGPAAVRALRGEGLLAKQPHTRPTDRPTVPTTARGAVFGSADPTLLWRGPQASKLFSATVSLPPQPPRVKAHHLPGDVLAAAWLNRRLVTLLHDGEKVWPHVIGKELKSLRGVEAPVENFHEVPLDLADLFSAPLTPLWLLGGDLLFSLGDSWWQLGRDGLTRAPSLIAASSSPTLDAPDRAYQFARVVHAGRYRFRADDADAPPRAVFGPAGLVACSLRHRVWTVQGSGRDWEPIGVGEHDRVAGVVMSDGYPALLTVSDSTLVVRLVSARHTKTLTDLAGPAHFSLHPRMPWIVRSTDTDVRVVDLATNSQLLRVVTDHAD